LGLNFCVISANFGKNHFYFALYIIDQLCLFDHWLIDNILNTLELTNLKDKIESYSQKVANQYQIRGVVRIDYLYDLDKEKLYVNEINTIPGSLAFYLFENNLSFTNLIDQLIEQAIKDKYNYDQKLNSFKSNVLSSTKLLKK
jgi:hypothetical protein